MFKLVDAWLVKLDPVDRPLVGTTWPLCWSTNVWPMGMPWWLTLLFLLNYLLFRQIPFHVRYWLTRKHKPCYCMGAYVGVHDHE